LKALAKLRVCCSHRVLPDLQEAAAQRFDEGLENALIEVQVAKVLEENVGKIADMRILRV